MERSYAEALASGYAWGQQDARKALIARLAGLPFITRETAEAIAGPAGTASPDDRDGSYLFAKAYGAMQQDYNDERRGMAVPVRDAYARWQETGGRTIEAEHDVEASLLAEARVWIRDTFAGQPDSGTVDPDAMTDDAVRKGMDVHYVGGWKAFRRHALSARYATRSQP